MQRARNRLALEGDAQPRRTDRRPWVGIIQRHSLEGQEAGIATGRKPILEATST